jgi:hypothetical protein
MNELLMTSNKKEKIEIPIMSDIIEVTISSGILYIYTYTSIDLSSDARRTSSRQEFDLHLYFWMESSFRK